MRRFTSTPFLFCLLAACSSPGPESPDLSDSDLRHAPTDMAGPKTCTLPYELRDIDMVTAGQVSVMQNAGTFTAQVDASAGGAMSAPSNPYVYIDLISGKRVDITDVQSHTSRDWDIAIKRYVVKLNGGDSGPAGETLTSVPNTTLAQVTRAPGGAYITDHYFDAMCNVQTDAIGGLATALSDWYGYDTVTNKLTPNMTVYVIKRRDGMGSIKLQFLGYYDGSGNGGHVSLTWGFLP